jgi:hypothetical protein
MFIPPSSQLLGQDTVVINGNPREASYPLRKGLLTSQAKH